MGAVKAYYVGFERVGQTDRYRARFRVGDGHRVSRAAFRSPDQAVSFGRRMAQALRWGAVAPEKIFV